MKKNIVINNLDSKSSDALQKVKEQLEFERALKRKQNENKKPEHIKKTDSELIKKMNSSFNADSFEFKGNNLYNKNTDYDSGPTSESSGLDSYASVQKGPVGPKGEQGLTTVPTNTVHKRDWIEQLRKDINDKEKSEKVLVEDKINYDEKVNHVHYYNNYSKEVIDMMVDVFGKQSTALWCEMTAFKYRMRMGTKEGNDVNQDLAKEKWYLNKAKELKG